MNAGVATATVIHEDLARLGQEISRLQAEKRSLERRLVELESRQRAMLEELRRAQRKYLLTPEGWRPVYEGMMIGADNAQRLTAKLFERALAAREFSTAEAIIELAVLNGAAIMWRDGEGRCMHAALAHAREHAIA